MILRREVAAEGRNRSWVNGSAATAGVVGNLGAALVDLHGQHEHQTLLRPADQRRILDAFAGAVEEARLVSALYAELQSLRQDLDNREERRREIESRADFLRFQLSEIDAAALQPGEDDALQSEAGRHEHSEELTRGASEVHDILYGADDSVADRMAAAKKRLERLADFDPALSEQVESLSEASITVSDVGRRMGDYAESIDHDPRRLAEVHRRLDMMFRMKRKYGPDLADVLETAQRVRSELSDLDESDHDIIVLSQRMDTAGAELKSAAGALSSKRRDAAARLGAAIASTLPALGLPGAVFDVALRAHGEVGAGGAEGVEFLVSPNPGFEPQPLARIGSGGELSRVMLALKSTLADVDRVPVLVFDEIDAGIGGVVASAVALKLAEVAERHQVFVVTHLAQVASRANTHLLVEKEQGANGTVTSVRPLTADARVEEIARMLGGDPESPTSRQHARELLRLT